MEIVYEDSDIFVINKPPGLIVNRSEAHRGVVTLQDWVEDYLKLEAGNLKLVSSLKPPFQPQASSFKLRSGIVHRLDKDTSGLLVVAKTPEALTDLQRQFKERKVRKGYLALVHGRVEPHSGVIDRPVGRNPKNSKKFAVVEDGREAITRYSVKCHVRGGDRNPQRDNFTLLDLEPKTGRTHQIRVHLKSIGHPVVGDKLYSSRKQFREAESLWRLPLRSSEGAEGGPRQFLHAYRLGFEHPRTGEWLTFEVDLPDDLKGVLRKTQNNSERRSASGGSERRCIRAPECQRRQCSGVPDSPTFWFSDYLTH